MSLPSGAGHDAQNMARICPMGMIFIPRVGGISHAPKEFSRPQDVTNGANGLLQALLKLDAASDGAGGAGSRFSETDALVAYIEPYDAEVISLYARGMSVREMEGVAPRPASCWAAAAPAFPRTNTQPVAADLENTATLSCPRNVYRTTPDGSASIF